MTTNRPYDAAHVSLIEEPGMVWALYIPDPEHAKDPQTVLNNLLDRRKYPDVETVAEMTRFYKKDGADFSGWVVRSGPDYTDPIPNKRQAMQHLRNMIDDYFSR